jgi:tyrosyl-tRNA synthetase
MGRKEGESLDFAQLLYIPMQVADVFALNVNLPHGGMDQRKAHVIAIEVGDKVFGYKPIAVHHHLLTGMHLSENERKKILEAKRTGNRELFEESVLDIKMSKSKPESAVFIHDSEEEIRRKITRAFCPAGETELNPILELLRYVIFRNVEEFEIINQKTGERKTFENYEALERAWVKGEIHPADLKNAVAEELIRILEPARKHFLEGKGKKYIEEMNEIRITR